jgi:hypothetical protein
MGAMMLPVLWWSTPEKRMAIDRRQGGNFGGQDELFSIFFYHPKRILMHFAAS